MSLLVVENNKPIVLNDTNINYIIKRDFLHKEEQELISEVADSEKFKSSPSWLGNFDLKCYYGNRILNTKLNEIARRMADEVPEQKFNTAFLQRYITGAYVAKHRDPYNNTGYTIIGVAGLFTGATTSITPTFKDEDNISFTLQAGDIAILPCTINGRQGHRHSVSPVISGTRYAFILNTIL